MQFKLPLFPYDTKMINNYVGFRQQDNFVYYLHSGSPVYCHKVEDKNSYRHTLAGLIVNNPCTITELSNALGINRKNVERYAKALREHGSEWFFAREDGRGQCHKMTPELLEIIRQKLNAGISKYRISKEHNISDSAIDYHLSGGTLKKIEFRPSSGSSEWSSPHERSQMDLKAAGGFGMATTRVEERLLGALEASEIHPVRFEACRSIAGGGVLLLLPFLPECGLLSYRNHYLQRRSGYYNFDSLFILMAFLYLCRVKSFEATKHLNPGDWGKLIGYDRIPEVKKIRGLIGEVTAQEGCSRWSAGLSGEWMKEEEPELFYVDGHVQVYHGYLANVGKKHVSRQKLCLPGMMEFWVNSSTGMPYFFVTAQVNEKMIEMLESEIVPRLEELHPVSVQHRAMMEENPDCPRFTLVFDREGYSPAFFRRLWEKHRIAIITYRKNVKDKWAEADFRDMKVETLMGSTTMKLCERESAPDSCPVREVRKFSNEGHRSSIVTTNKIMTTAQIATYMFGRWIQENFFRYMRQEYALDKIIQYGMEQIDENFNVVNREYSNITYRIKKGREKLARKKAGIYNHRQQMPENGQGASKKMAKWMETLAGLLEQATVIDQEIEQLLKERTAIPYKIPVSQMPQETRYNKLNRESKHLQNIVKMICFRAEMVLPAKLATHLARSHDQIRAFVKSIIMLTIDLYPDSRNNRLEVTLYPLANKRSNLALEHIIELINQSITKYPGTDLTLFYKITTV